MLILVQFEIENEMETVPEPVWNAPGAGTLNADIVFKESDSKSFSQLFVNVVLSPFVSGRNPLFVRIREVKAVCTQFHVFVFFGDVSLFA